MSGAVSHAEEVKEMNKWRVSQQNLVVVGEGGLQRGGDARKPPASPSAPRRLRAPTPSHICSLLFADRHLCRHSLVHW